jgi:hypothetical protein
MKKRITSIPELQSLMLLAVLVVVYVFLLSSWFSIALFCIGSLFSWWLLWADKTFLYKQYAERIDRSTQQVVAQTSFCISRSFLFLVTMYPLAFFTVTSSTSPLGLGMMLSVLVQIAVEASPVFTMGVSLNSLFQFGGKPLNAQESQILAGIMIAAVPVAVILSL